MASRWILIGDVWILRKITIASLPFLHYTNESKRQNIMGKPESPVLLTKRADIHENTGQTGGAPVPRELVDRGRQTMLRLHLDQA